MIYLAYFNQTNVASILLKTAQALKAFLMCHYLFFAFQNKKYIKLQIQMRLDSIPERIKICGQYTIKISP